MLPKKYSWVDTSNPRFCQALSEVVAGDTDIVTIAGGGGCGKSVIYRIAYDLHPDRSLPTASTGIAAFNLAVEGVPASTVHSALRICPRDWYDPDEISSRTVDILSRFDTLLIDEVSMISINLMDYILNQVSVVNSKRSRRGLKKLRVILFGDVMQLPPVVGKLDPEIAEAWTDRYGENYYFFNSPLYRGAYRRTVELYEAYRQEDDKFKSILDAVRMGTPSPNMLNTLNRHVMAIGEFTAQERKGSFMYLAGSNAKVSQINEAYQKQFEDRGVLFSEHEAEYEGDVDKKDFLNIPDMVKLYIGQQVMCTANDTDHSYKNGMLGKIVDFTSGNLPIVESSDGLRFVVRRQKFPKYGYYYDENKDRFCSKVIGMKIQLACKSAYAVTFHKAQGLTLDNVYIDVSDIYADHSLYLGLSRLRTIEGLGLSGMITSWMVKRNINREALSFFNEDRDVISGQLF